MGRRGLVSLGREPDGGVLPRPQGGVGTGFISAQGGQLLHPDLTVLRGLEKTPIYLASPTAFYVKLFCRLKYFITL